MKLECKRCGCDEVFHHEEDARIAVDHILATNDFGTSDPPIGCLRAALTWFEHEGKYCDYCTHMLSKDC
jgi:hypothetical protein